MRTTIEWGNLNYIGENKNNEELNYTYNLTETKPTELWF